MPAKLTLHPPERASRVFLFQDRETVTLGRDPSSDVVLDDPRVSKRHARLSRHDAGWLLEDLGSKNGTSVNGLPAVATALGAAATWISFGGLPAQFELISEEEAAAVEAERARRRETTVEMRRRLTAELGPPDLLRRLLESSMEVTGAERGFVLVLAPDGTLQAEVAVGFASSHLHGQQFAGSLGAIERVLTTGKPVVVSDAPLDSFFGKRPSVIDQELRTLACVPLEQEDRILGFIYVDSRRRALGFTDLDLEILEALAEQAAIVLASIRLDGQIRELFTTMGTAAEDRTFLRELQRRVEEVTRGLSGSLG